MDRLGERLARNRVAIARDLEPKKYWDYLYQEGVFDLDDIDELKAEKGRKNMTDALLGKVERSGPGGIAVFAKTLKQKQPHLFEVLQSELPSEPLATQVQGDITQLNIREMTQYMTGLHVHGEPRPFVRKALGPVEHGQGDESKLNDQQGNTVIPAQSASPFDEEPPFVIPTDVSKLPAHIRPDCSEVYPMTSKPRGIALIINNEEFVQNKEKTEKEQEKEELEHRQGSEKDLQALEKLFQALDFKVKTERNITRAKFLNVLDDIAADNHSLYDCFVLCLMSHGKEGAFYCADGEVVLMETISDFFSNSRCGTLRGKPKVFFIQACRGNTKEKGVVKDSPGNPRSPQPETADDNADTDWHFSFQSQEVIPDHADLLMAYSTVSGYASFRNPNDGSRFVRCLVEVFREKACCEDVLSMLTMVNERISKMGEINSKQVGQPTSTLTKKLFFWPGL